MHADTRVNFANTLRGFAALAVIISHYFGVFWSGRSTVGILINAPILSRETHAMPNYISWLHFFPIFNWGAYGVALFFIISGFVIPFSLQKLNWLGFSVNRFFPIIPTYSVGFSITLIALLISTEYFSRTWPYSLHEVAVHYLPGIRDIMWSRNIDGIIWTLEIEMKFYLICTLLIVWFRQYSLKVFLTPIALFILALYITRIIPVWASTNIQAYQLAMTYLTSSQYLIFMFIGVMFHYLHQGKIEPNKAYFGIGGLFLLFAIHWWAGPYFVNLTTAWSYGFALLTFSFAYAFPNFFKANRTFDFLANISYPLYVIHGVSGYVALRIMLDKGFNTWISLVVVTTTCLILAWLLHKIIEHPSQTLGKKLGLKLTTHSLSVSQLIQNA